MPCNSDHLRPSMWEVYSNQVLELLYEVGLRDQPPGFYGRPESISADTAELCAWCKSHDVSKQSLELQIWWRDHQAADRAREEEEEAQQEIDKIKKNALAKLTDEEKKALRIG